MWCSRNFQLWDTNQGCKESWQHLVLLFPGLKNLGKSCLRLGEVMAGCRMQNCMVWGCRCGYQTGEREEEEDGSWAAGGLGRKGCFLMLQNCCLWLAAELEIQKGWLFNKCVSWCLSSLHVWYHTSISSDSQKSGLCHSGVAPCAFSSDDFAIVSHIRAQFCECYWVKRPEAGTGDPRSPLIQPFSSCLKLVFSSSPVQTLHTMSPETLLFKPNLKMTIALLVDWKWGTAMDGRKKAGRRWTWERAGQTGKLGMAHLTC